MNFVRAIFCLFAAITLPSAIIIGAAAIIDRNMGEAGSACWIGGIATFSALFALSVRDKAP